MNECLNIRLEMDHLNSNGTIADMVILELTYQWLNYVLPEKYGDRNKLVVIFQRMGYPSFSQIVNAILATCQALLVNIDEVQSISAADIKTVLQLFGGELCNGSKIYFTLTGI